MSMTLGQRLKAIRKAQPGKMNQEDFAKSLGLTRMAYSMYELDRVVPSESVPVSYTHLTLPTSDLV